MRKELIKNSFDKAAKTYDTVAEIQKLSSATLANLLNKKEVTSVIDIGCGTGNTSLELFQKYPNAEYTFCDISENMLKIACEKFPKKAEIICSDAEKYDFTNHYDLAISNLSMQWFSDLDDFIEKIKKSCDSVAFSVLLDSSFENYRKHFKFPPTFEYPSIEKLLEIPDLKKYMLKRYTIEFENFFGVARYFKKLGAALKSHDDRSNYSDRSESVTSSSPITLEYDIFFAVI